MIIPLYLKAVFTVAAIVISLIAYIPYIIDMFKGKCRPHNYTWITIFLVTISVAYTQVIGGAGPAAIPTIVGCLINGFILLLSLTKYGTNDVVLIDKICLAVSVLGVLSFLVFRDQPILSLAIVSIAEVSSFIPTFRKTKNDPYSESLPSYYLLIVKLSDIDETKMNPCEWSDLPNYWERSRVKLFNAKLKQWAESKGYDFVDLYQATSSDPDFITDKLEDGLHPNDAGHELIANVVFEAIKDKYLK
jgi:hypothetical protein